MNAVNNGNFVRGGYNLYTGLSECLLSVSVRWHLVLTTIGINLVFPVCVGSMRRWSYYSIAVAQAL